MKTTLPPEPTREELRALGQRLGACEAPGIAAAVTFLLGESRGLWHNRARAMFARRLKHCSLEREVATAVVACICARLERGNFAEQFADQIRLALHLDHGRVLEVAQRCLVSPVGHVRRYAAWVVRFHAAQPQPDNASRSR